MNENEFGIDVESLAPPVSCTIPTPVPGRCASIDGDALAYMVAAGCEDEPFAVCKTTFDTALRTRIAMCAAETCRLHLTGFNKGNRFEIAFTKEYQGNRTGKIKPKHLSDLRAFMQERYTGGDILCILNENQEADDGMAQDNFNAIQQGRTNMSIIHSIDKDLTMCSGLHCNWTSYDIVEVKDFGFIKLDESGSTKKIKGYGTAFFWAQMLTGDTADNIPGLPSIKGKYALQFCSKAVQDAKLVVETGLLKGKPATAAQVDKAKATVEEAMAKGKPCGPTAAYELLRYVTTDLDAFMLVLRLYRAHYGEHPLHLRHWDGGEIIKTVGDVVLEQARLLWMRRYPDEDVLSWIGQVVGKQEVWTSARV